MNKTFFIVLIILSSFVWAHNDDDHHHHGSDKVSESMAIQDVDDHGGIKLSPEAIKTIKIKTQKISDTSITISRSSFVSFAQIKGVYIKRGDYFYFIEVPYFKLKGSQISFKLDFFKNNDELVVEGVDLLRISDVFAKDESEYGHDH